MGWRANRFARGMVNLFTTQLPALFELCRVGAVCAVIVAVLFTGCAGPRYAPTLESSAPASDGPVLELSYVDQLNAHVSRVLLEIDDSGNEREALAMATHSGRQANPYLGAAITAVASYDYEHSKKLLPIWSALAEFTRAQSGHTMNDSRRLQAFYSSNADASQEVAQFLIDQFLSIGMFVNLTVTPVTPRFLLPLDRERVWPGVNATAALRDVFGSDTNTDSLSLHAISSGGVDDIYFAGLTMGSVAVLNKPLTRGLAQLYEVSPADTEEVIVANEAVHLLLAQRYGPVSSRDWPVEQLNIIAQSPFRIDAIHVEEFLSDAVSIRTNDVGPLIAYNSLLANSVRTEADGSRQGNIDSRYGYTAEFFLQALESAEVWARIPQAQRQAATLREVGALGGRTAMDLVAGRPDPRVIGYIQQAYLDMSRRLLKAIDGR